jgi:3-dehydroquinate dehydratase-2
MKILVLHGPNLNLFGRKEPHIYGKTTLAEINARLEKLALDLNVTLDIIQSNHEGDLIDFLHKNIDEAQGALVNPAGLTQHGVRCTTRSGHALPDAGSPCPHRGARAWRAIMSPAVKGTIQGLGPQSYLAALRALVEIQRDAGA